MKKRMVLKCAWIPAAFLCMLPVAAAAADASARFVERFDKNNDGKLKLNEFPRENRRAFRRLDRNQDGVLTVEEHRRERALLSGFRKEAEEQVERLFKAKDKDGDGKLARHDVPPWAARNFFKADADGDGVLSRRELTLWRFKLNRRRAMQQRSKEAMEPPVPPAFSDVPYGEHEKQRFDIWIPESGKPTPLVIYIHGGGFRGGDKSRVNGPLIGKLLAEGIGFASMNYRLTDVGPYPMPMHDCARGLQTIRYRAADFNIDPERIGLMGGSAGAGISQWLAFHDDLAESGSPDPVARQSTRVRCAAPSAAQCSYDPRFISELFDSDRVHSALPAFYGLDSDADVSNPRFFPLFEDASPITHLTADDPPVFLYYPQPNEPLPKNSSPQQYIHHPGFGFHLKEKMDALGIECTLRLREQSPHFPDDEIVAFFRRHLK